ncbi:hypothetical protein HID58_091036 [Brassica napus]|uniref:Protein JAZ13 n=1 Tax=Brassica napus TaxID=3708 RepID=A0ABQ7X4H2_BRANA|nr:protein JAZ13-like [Brassica napus]XP_048629981.1 protein JAZ13-like [Brassica napus]KAH0850031.1 hypothetical protein HID58_095841 [Brassica napus]KAH0851417.1 hypothetical protein HID58_091036 [Brassica napus]
MENCSLDLCLSSVTSSLQSCRRDSKVSQSLATRTKEINAFYSGRVREYDLVEIQIRAVIEMASKERDITALELAPVRLESPLVFSVKRSVERFLEKRKKRSKYVATPYSYTCSSTSSSSSHHF